MKIWIRKALIISVFALCFFAPESAYSENILLKSGQAVNGSVVDRGDDYIEVDVGIETPIRFYWDEIQSIDGDAQQGENPQTGQGVEDNLSVTDEAVESTASSAEVKAPRKSFLWRVQGVDKELFLFGSIHLGKPSMYPLTEVVEDAFAKSDILAMEVNIDDLDPEQVQQVMASKAMYADGDNLKNNLSQSTLIKLKKRLRMYGLELDQFLSFKPWFIAVTLIQLQIKELGFDTEYGVDLYFSRRADGKTILELESLEKQLSLFESFAQGKFLEYTLVSMDETEEMLDVMIKSWKSGDAETLKKIIITDVLTEKPELMSIYKKLFFDRNIEMTEKVKEYLNSDGTHFVVVGAGHLIGNQGIVELLRQEGYVVEQL